MTLNNKNKLRNLLLRIVPFYRFLVLRKVNKITKINNSVETINSLLYSKNSLFKSMNYMKNCETDGIEYLTYAYNDLIYDKDLQDFRIPKLEIIQDETSHEYLKRLFSQKPKLKFIRETKIKDYE